MKLKDKFMIAVHSGLFSEIAKMIVILCGFSIAIHNYEKSILIFCCLAVLQAMSLFKAIRFYRFSIKALGLKYKVEKDLIGFLDWKSKHPDMDDQWYFDNVLNKKSGEDNNGI